MSKHIKFNATLMERQQIHFLAIKAERLGLVSGDDEKLNLRMDLTATNANGCPMDFAKLLEADDFNFVHDICGIMRHIDRETGKLGGHFLPRCAKPKK